MPIKSEVQKLRLPENLDRRRKISQQDMETIANDKTSSNHALARHYNVSRRLIQVIRNPSLAATFKDRLKKAAYWRGITKEQHRVAQGSTRKHRKANEHKLTLPC